MTSSDHRHHPPLLAIVLLVMGLFALAMAQRKPAQGQTQPPVLNQLSSGQGRARLGEALTLSNVTVQKVTQADIIWVGNNANQSILVMLQPSVNPIDAQGNPTPVAAGDQVRVTGHVLAAPSTQTLQGWGISAADAARVQKQGVVLQAVTFQLLQRNH